MVKSFAQVAQDKNEKSPISTFRGLSAESMEVPPSLDPADKPQDVGMRKTGLFYFLSCAEGIALGEDSSMVAVAAGVTVAMYTLFYNSNQVIERRNEDKLDLKKTA